MGHILSKLSKSNDSNVKDKVLLHSDKLYKPENEFNWKNASPAEIHKSSIPHYAKKFEALKEKFAI